MNVSKINSGYVLVGLDGSTASAVALRWAASYARATGAGLHAMHVFTEDHLPTTVWIPGLPAKRYAPANPSRTSTEAKLSSLYGDLDPEPGWELHFVNGSAGAELVLRARTAGLLVLGAGEHRTLDRLVHGSTNHYCLTTATCPVVTVPVTAATALGPHTGDLTTAGPPW